MILGSFLEILYYFNITLHQPASPMAMGITDHIPKLYLTEKD